MHIAAISDSFEDIHLITEEALMQKDIQGSSPLHFAAYHNTLSTIPKHLLTHQTIGVENNDGKTVLHVAAGNSCLKDIPKKLLTVEALNKKDNGGNTVWHYLNEQIKDIPQDLITEELLDLKIFTETNKNHIKNVITTRLNRINKIKEGLKVFIAENKPIAKDLIHLDPRLIVTKANKDTVHLKLEGAKEKIIFSKEGVFIGKENHESLNKAVLFIEKANLNIEQSIILPASDSLKIGDFVL